MFVALKPGVFSIYGLQGGVGNWWADSTYASGWPRCHGGVSVLNPVTAAALFVTGMMKTVRPTPISIASSVIAAQLKWCMYYFAAEYGPGECEPLESVYCLDDFYL